MRYQIDWPHRQGEPKREPSILVTKDGVVLGGTPTLDWTKGMGAGEAFHRLHLCGAVINCIGVDCALPPAEKVITRRGV